MKLKTIFSAIAAFCLLAIGCTNESLNVGDLAEIKIENSYLTISEKGGSIDLTFSATDSWKIEGAPEWLTFAPASGSAGDCTVKVEAGAAMLDRTANVKIVCAGKEQNVVISQPGDPELLPKYPKFEAGEYWIMFKETDGTWIVGKPVPATSSYGWVYAQPAVNKAGVLSSTAATVFTFTAVEGGFTIQDASKRYYYITDKYDSFNLSEDRRKDGSDVWTVEQVGDQIFDIVSAGNGKIMQYDPNHNSAGAYANVDASKYKPFLVKAEAPAPEPIVIENKKFDVEKEAGELNVPATLNTTNVIVSTKADWISYKGIKEIDGAKNLVFAYTENTAAERSAKITVTATADGASSSVELTINQAIGVVVPNMVTINDSNLPTKYPTEVAEVVYSDYTFSILNVANYGTGIQMKKEGGYIENKTAFEDIKTIVLTYHPEKSFYPTNLTLTAGEDTITPTIDETAKTATYDLSAKTYTAFKLINNSTYAVYLSKIEIYY